MNQNKCLAFLTSFSNGNFFRCNAFTVFAPQTDTATSENVLKKYTSRDRTANEIANWLSRQLAPPVQTIADDAELNVFQQRAGRIAVIGAVKDVESSTGKRVMRALTTVADQLEDVSVAVMLDEKHDENSAHVALLRTFDEPRLFYRDTLDDGGEALAKWVHAHRKPLLDRHSIAAYGLDEPLVFLHRDLSANALSDAATVAAVRAAAKHFRGEPIAFAWLDAAEWDGVRSGLSGKRYPALTIDNILRVNRRYAFDERTMITQDTVVAWVQVC